MKFQFAEIIAATTSTVAMNPATAAAAAERRMVRINLSSGSVVESLMAASKSLPFRLSIHSWRRAATGSSRAANHAGMSAATEQIANAQAQMIATSEATICAGISAN